MDDVDTFVAQFTDAHIPHVLVGMQYFSPTDIPTQEAPLLYMTTRLGEQRRSGFTPSIALLDQISLTTDRKAVVEDKAAWLFVCGKNILKEGLVSCPYAQGFVLVCNQRGEVLGYGKRTGVGVTNLLDRGDFLRRER